eukprot:GEMP01044345.1.p1 GENE.GEMP01044345.1~~GEMP01044345.1.p1  ORF type:complete len:351 (+),score=80.69 GEMP01044345.1:117-1169(+)
MKFLLVAAMLASRQQTSFGSAVHGSSSLIEFQSCICEHDCTASKVKIVQEFDEPPSPGLSYADIIHFLGTGPVSNSMRMVRVDSVPLTCIDDRVPTASLATPGGDLGEFILGLDTYVDSLPLTDDDGIAPVQHQLTDRMVRIFLQKYLESIPNDRAFVHCTDDRAIRHLEQQVQFENLDLTAPPERLKESLLAHLTDAENQGDSHIRLLLKHPEWYHVDPQLVPMVVRAFYNLLWTRQAPHVSLLILQGNSNPSAFLEISTNKKCEAVGMAPIIDPRSLSGRAAFVSHMTAATVRRSEIAEFFARIANATPHKMDKTSLKDRMDRHGYMALDTTGKRIAEGLPFYSVAYV